MSKEFIDFKEWRDEQWAESAKFFLCGLAVFSIWAGIIYIWPNVAIQEPGFPPPTYWDVPIELHWVLIPLWVFCFLLSLYFRRKRNSQESYNRYHEREKEEYERQMTVISHNRFLKRSQKRRIKEKMLDLQRDLDNL